MNQSKFISKGLSAVVILQAFVLLILIFGGPSLPAAHAQIPDAGAQRDQMIEQMKATNEKLDKLLNLLSGGDLQVKLAKPDEGKTHP